VVALWGPPLDALQQLSTPQLLFSLTPPSEFEVRIGENDEEVIGVEKIYLLRPKMKREIAVMIIRQMYIFFQSKKCTKELRTTQRSMINAGWDGRQRMLGDLSGIYGASVGDGGRRYGNFWYLQKRGGLEQIRGSQRNDGGVLDRIGEHLEVSKRVKIFAGIEKYFGRRDEH